MRSQKLKFIKKFSVPSHLVLGKKKKKLFSLNLNVYRNSHFHVLNQAKVLFKEIIRPTIETIPQLNRCVIVYEVYPKTKRKFDVANICSVVDKFLCDALTEFNILPEDNYEHVPTVIYSYGSVDKDNPRVDVTIYEIKEDPMKITVVVEQQDIIDLINRRAGLTLDGNVDLQLKDGTISVTIDTEEPAKKATKVAPVVKKAKVVEEVVEESVVEEEEDSVPFETEEEKPAPAKAQDLFSKDSKEPNTSEAPKSAKSLFGKK